jgi:thermolabile hemolysin
MNATFHSRMRPRKQTHSPPVRSASEPSSQPSSQPPPGIRQLALVCGGLLLASGVEVATAPFTQVYAFGSELTATSGGPYADGRWCNGPVWVEHLAARLGLRYTPECNRATGGADSARILNQVIALPPPPQAASALFVVMPGLLDFGRYVGEGLDDAFWDRQIAQMVDNTAKAVDRLYLKGARQIAVVNLPDMTRFPQFNALSEAQKLYHRQKAQQHNSTLETRLEVFTSRSPDARLRVIGFFHCLDFMLDHAAQFGLTRIDLAAWHDDALMDKSFGGPGSRYVFWDYVHPTSAAHALLAQTLEATVLDSRVSIGPADTGWTVTAERLAVGVSYQLEWSDNLDSWTEIHPFDPASVSSPVFQIDVQPSAGFFRLRSVPHHARALREPGPTVCP